MLKLIYNPLAGRGRAPAAIAQVTGALTSAGADFELIETVAPGHATDIAAASAPGSTLVAVGGDGTVHEIAVGMWRAGLEDRTLGVIPVGSGDDFAFANGIDRRDVLNAVNRVLHGTRVKVDLPLVNGSPYVNSLGVGFDAEVGARFARSPRFLKGLAGYLYATFASLSRLDTCNVEVEADGQVVYDGRALLVATQNGPRTGGSFLFAPDAVIDDGWLDVVIARDFNVASTMALLPRVMKGTHIGHPKVTILRCQELRQRWERPRHAHMEGELLPLGTEFHVKLLAAALNVLR
ncbi:MAG: diacylglycerol kinase family lipid kinase [Trueperaceae bacterium]|nr:diacylglycerol kinase family lipid kinase [Trueperaceae bacterium]